MLANTHYQDLDTVTPSDPSHAISPDKTMLNHTTPPTMLGRVRLVARVSDCHTETVGSFPQLVLLSKALYHACFVCGQRCNWWSHLPKLTLSVISDLKPIIYIFRIFIMKTTRSFFWLKTGDFDPLIPSPKLITETLTWPPIDLEIDRVTCGVLKTKILKPTESDHIL